MLSPGPHGRKAGSSNTDPVRWHGAPVATREVRHATHPLDYLARAQGPGIDPGRRVEFLLVGLSPALLLLWNAARRRAGLPARNDHHAWRHDNRPGLRRFHRRELNQLWLYTLDHDQRWQQITGGCEHSVEFSVFAVRLAAVGPRIDARDHFGRRGIPGLDGHQVTPCSMAGPSRTVAPGRVAGLQCSCSAGSTAWVFPLNEHPGKPHRIDGETNMA